MPETRKKPLPDITWQNIAPPYPHYNYFADCETCPFRYESTGFDMVNAWWLIEAATLVYADEAFVRDRFKKAGLKEVELISGGQSTECFVAGNEKFAIVAFRGSEIRFRKEDESLKYIWGDWKTNFTFLPVAWEGKGRVHQGFKGALDPVWEELSGRLSRLRRENKRIWMTGHSLGGALATLAAERFGDVQGLYTFGSPRVGDSDFRNAFSVMTYRFVNDSDIVTKVPPSDPYHHVGELKYIDGEGHIHDRFQPQGGWMEDIGSTLSSIFNVNNWLKPDVSRLVPDGVRDHVPTLYATHIWNSIP